VIAPVDVLRASPDGRAGETEKVIGAVPPVYCTGVNAEADREAGKVLVGMTTTAEIIGETCNENVLVAVAEEESVTVTV
jgi:hypothetical protein